MPTTSSPMFHILITMVGAPEFLHAQLRLLRVHCRDRFEVVVVNDAKEAADPSNWNTDDAANAISHACKHEGLTELRFPQHQHRRRLRPPRISLPASRTAEAIQFGYNYLIKAGARRIAIMDSDMFPIEPFSFEEMLDGADLAGVPQLRVNRFLRGMSVSYLWNGILLINTETLSLPGELDLGCGYVNFTNTDVGGKISLHLKRFPKTKVRYIASLNSGGWNEVPANIPGPLSEFIRRDPMNGDNFFSEFYGGCLFHFRGGGNWQAIQGGPCFTDRYHLFLIALQGMTRQLDQGTNA